MRISDWSSDVCSSDLLHLGAQVDRAHVVALADQASELGLYLLARRQLLALTDLRRLEHVVERAIELLAYSRHHRLEGLARLGHRALGADAVLAGIGEAGFRRLQRLVGLAEPQIGKHTSELQSLMRISYDVFCMKKKKK